MLQSKNITNTLNRNRNTAAKILLMELFHVCSKTDVFFLHTKMLTVNISVNEPIKPISGKGF